MMQVITNVGNVLGTEAHGEPGAIQNLFYNTDRGKQSENGRQKTKS